jgi:hypothetical protein
MTPDKQEHYALSLPQVTRKSFHFLDASNEVIIRDTPPRINRTIKYVRSEYAKVLLLATGEENTSIAYTSLGCHKCVGQSSREVSCHLHHLH